MDEPRVETELADSEPERRSGPWKLIIVVAIVTAIGVWLVPDRLSEPPDPVSQRPASPEVPETQAAASGPSLLADAQAIDPSVDLSTALPAPAAGARVGRPGARARTLIARMRASTAPDLDEVHAAAAEAQADGQLTDAYLLYFFAAREGHAGAALALAQQADPALRDPTNSVYEAPDLNQAHKWYEIAARHGAPGAEQQLAELRARIERLAAGGDARAQRLSLLWQ